MCGISGVIAGARSASELRQAVAFMNEAEARRGPDDEGVFEDAAEGVALGHRRLAFLDLSPAGKGPMERRGIVLTYNGEIYNFKELREELRGKGYAFTTATDTEVIIALYEAFGEAAFPKLRGMFAFGLWDGRQKKLYLVRDRYGIKPLYYAASHTQAVFASSVRALAGCGLLPAERDPRAMIGFLLFGFMPAPFTTIKGIAPLPPGHFLVYEKGSFAVRRYYDPLPAFAEGRKPAFEEAVQRTKELLREASRVHLISDAPLGVFLSGGLDSSALAAFAAAGRSGPLTTLSATFDEGAFSEKRYQDMVAARIGSDHREARITSNDFFGSFPEIFLAMDQPTVDGVNSFFIAKAAKEAGLKAVFSGAGGDELFYGYRHYGRAAALRALERLPRFVQKPLFGAARGKYGRLAYLSDEGPLAFYLSVRGLFVPREVARLLGVSEGEVDAVLREVAAVWTPEDMKILRRLPPAQLLSFLEFQFYLKDQLLRDADMMSMYHSVEVRVPFLDHVLVEYVAGLAPDLKLAAKGGPNKPLLAAAARDVLPEEILKRKKMGFAFPFADWISRAPVSAVPADLSREAREGRAHWSRTWAKFVVGRF